MIDQKKHLIPSRMNNFSLKLQHHGIGVVALHLLKSYLTTRKQYVNTENSISSQKPISMGVHQGSILSPLFYIIYINDLHIAINQ